MKYQAVFFAFFLVCLSYCTSSMSKWNPQNDVYKGKTDEWKTYSYNGVYVDVNYQELGLAKTPKVFTYVTCTEGCWQVSGVTSLYDLSKNHFRVYLRGNGINIYSTLAKANNFVLHYSISSQDI